MERIYVEHLTKTVWNVDVSGVSMRGRPRKEWMEGVERVLELRGLSVKQCKETARVRCESKAIVDG